MSNNNANANPSENSSSKSDLNPIHVARGSAVVKHLKNLLGLNPAIVPCWPKTKISRFKRISLIKREYNELDEWLECIGRSENLSIRMGTYSGLYSLDFDYEAHLEEFLKYNPAFKGTLQTKAARPGNLWFTLHEGCPSSFDVKDQNGKNVVEFRADGRLTMISGIHPTGERYRALNSHRPIRIRWDEIQWPPEWKIPGKKENKPSDTPVGNPDKDLYMEITAIHGEPFQQRDNGQVVFNQIALVEIFHREYPITRNDAGAFLHYSAKTGIWKPINNAGVRRELGDYMAEYARRVNMPEILSKRTDKELTALVRHLEGRAPLMKTADEDTMLLHFSNGVVDASDPAPILLPFDPKYYARNRIAFTFDPEAKCPRFISFLRDALLSDDIRLLQKWGGMALLGRNLAHAILLITGKAGSGKSTLVEIIGSVIGKDNMEQLRTLHLEQNRFEMARYEGKTLLVGSDVSGKYLNRSGASMLKSMTGGDFLSGEKKGQNGSVPLRGNYNIVITSNRRPQLFLDGDTEAWARRVKIISFQRTGEKCVGDLAKTIVAEEASGIINWMLDGLVALREDLDNRNGWVVSGKQKARIRELIEESDSVRTFARQMLIQEPHGNVTSEELLNAYVDFCDNFGWSHDQRMFGQEIQPIIAELFEVKQRHDIVRFGRAKRGYRGVVLEGKKAEQQAYVANLE